MAQNPNIDLLIAGGGLAGGLIALALAKRRPELKVAIVEAGERLGGNHIWSFFDSDVAPAERALVDPLVCHRWSGNDVRFPGHRRTLAGSYNSTESERLDATVRAALPPEAVITAAIAALDPQGATLADGSRIDATAVIDTRGTRDLSVIDLGWQKFVGRLLRLNGPHGLTRPVIMDATVDQAEGYRFVYLLPFGPDRMFVEDTYYSDTPTLDVPAIEARIDAYAQAQGWSVAEVERQEVAALPIAMGGDFAQLWPARDRVARAGMAAGLFQPMTGYSLPDAVRTAALVAALPYLSPHALYGALRGHARNAWEERGFYRLLARMLFRAADPPERYRLLERFYRLDEGLIGRFYGGQSTLIDKARIFVGKPPVALRRALGALREAE
ncbi:lycopene beta-cyclase CrtY [Sphingomonas crusticola]|uniref:lycopene beta-cyclase CrtY n=1 Tax=Sphingomonas crusticola TaxID=1697973 RepID=UPI000E24E5E7|nr:lycopene beta-cyclase CrtY [Sphingomonas crusticola]